MAGGREKRDRRGEEGGREEGRRTEGGKECTCIQWEGEGGSRGVTSNAS